MIYEPPRWLAYRICSTRLSVLLALQNAPDLSDLSTSRSLALPAARGPPNTVRVAISAIVACVPNKTIPARYRHRGPKVY